MSASNYRLGLVLSLAVITGCAKPPAPPVGKTPIRLALNWLPESEHGGYYAALVHGYFAEENLDVTIVPGNAQINITQQIAAGRAEFGEDNADGILMGRAAKFPIVGLFAPLQESPVCIIVHEESGISELSRLQSATLAMQVGAPYAKFAMSKIPTLESDNKIVSYTGSIVPFLNDKRFAQQGYVFSEPLLMKEKGAHPKVIPISTTGYNPYAGVLFTSEKYRRDHPEIVQKMVRACRRGWIQYLNDPAKANEKINQLNPDQSPEVLREGAKALKPLVMGTLKDKDMIGDMSADRWAQLKDQLIECKVIEDRQFPVEDAYTTDYLKPSASVDVQSSRRSRDTSPPP